MNGGDEGGAIISEIDTCDEREMDDVRLGLIALRKEGGEGGSVN